MAKHIDIVGVLLMIWGAFQLLIALVMGLLFSGLGGGLAVLGGSAGEEELMVMGGIYAVMGVVIGLITAVMAIPSLAAGWGVRKRAPWARIAAMIVAGLALMSFPMGTMLGIYTFITLLDAEVADEFAAAG